MFRCSHRENNSPVLVFHNLSGSAAHYRKTANALPSTFLLGAGLRDRELNKERCPDTYLGFEPELTLVFLHNHAMGQRQSLSGAVPKFGSLPVFPFQCP